MHDLSSGGASYRNVEELVEQISSRAGSALFLADKLCIVASNRPEGTLQTELRELAVQFRLDGTGVVDTVRLVSFLSSREKVAEWVQQALPSLPMLDLLPFCLSMANDGVGDIALPADGVPTLLLSPLCWDMVDEHGNHRADYVLLGLLEKPRRSEVVIFLIDPRETASILGGLSGTGESFMRLVDSGVRRAKAARDMEHIREIEVATAELERMQRAELERMAQEMAQLDELERPQAIEMRRLEEETAGFKTRLQVGGRTIVQCISETARIRSTQLTDEQADAAVADAVARSEREAQDRVAAPERESEEVRRALSIAQSMRSPARRRLENTEDGLNDVQELLQDKDREYVEKCAGRQRKETNASEKEAATQVPRCALGHNI